MNLFLDCEWADHYGYRLVSLALVSDDDRHRFYGEVSPLPRAKPWVQAVVYPLLEHGWASMRPAELAEALHRFLTAVPDPVVVFDHVADGRLLRETLSLAARPLPLYSELHIQRNEHLNALIGQFFTDHTQRHRHHAMADAEALRWACGQCIADGTKP